MVRILVIDDDDEIRLLVKKILARDGYEVLEASNGTLGLAIVEQKRPDVVITEVLMPEDGRSRNDHQYSVLLPRGKDHRYFWR